MVLLDFRQLAKAFALIFQIRADNSAPGMLLVIKKTLYCDMRIYKNEFHSGDTDYERRKRRIK